jgi:hypothetical protein
MKTKKQTTGQALKRAAKYYVQCNNDLRYYHPTTCTARAEFLQAERAHNGSASYLDSDINRAEQYIVRGVGRASRKVKN